MPLPLSLEIVGTDRSHSKAGGQEADLIACRSVANDLPILGRLSYLPAGGLHEVPKGGYLWRMLGLAFSSFICFEPLGLHIGTDGGGSDWW